MNDTLKTSATISLGSISGTAQFTHTDDRLWLTSLCGMAAVADDSGERACGVAVIQADGRRYEGADLHLADQLPHVARQAHQSPQDDQPVSEQDALTCRWQVGATGLMLTTHWQVDPATGVVSRRDMLANSGATPVTVTRCLARVGFPPGRYECYAQDSRWSHENQGAWLPLHTGQIVLRHEFGRTTQGGTPYLALRPVGAGIGIVCHILPEGNWTIKVGVLTNGGDLPFAVLELGLADENLHRTLQPGERLALPELLFQPLPQGEPGLAAPALHRHVLAHHFAVSKPEAPVVFNTWFYEFDILDVPRLRAQLAAAKDMGCEIFVIDAGWYGAGGPNWSAQTGDWREKTEAAFHGRMGAFADEVRAAGLGFGIWMEPERFGPQAPIRTEHPEWFVPVGEMARIDLTQPAAWAWLRSEIGRLVETYQLAWMKVDFNFILDADASGAELADYASAWYRMLDEVRATYPRTFFEGCSSGAMRGDLTALTHFDGHFLSDTVNPVDVLRISQGAWLRLPPGRIARWLVLRSAGQVAPRYTRSLADSPPTILVPGGAVWEPAETVDLNFALIATLPGMLGFSGDLASLAPEHRDIVRQGIGFYKRWRRFITGAVAHLLTPPEPLARREGWAGVQLQAPGEDTSLAFVYRLGNAGAPLPLALRGLRRDGRYRVCQGIGEVEIGAAVSGEELMGVGLRPDFGAPSPAAVSVAEVYSVRAV